MNQQEPATTAYLRFLRYYYLTTALYDFVFAYAVYTVFFSLRGMTVMDISVLLAWWSLTSIMAEIPTGALADSWSRRKMLALAPLIKALCFVTWSLAGKSFYLFGLGFLFWSIGGAFASGTSEALLYDTLVHYGRREEYEKALGRRQFYFHIALAVAVLSGGIIASYRMEWAILLSVVPLLASAVFALLIAEMPKVESTGEVHYLQHIRLALREIRGSRLLWYLLIYLYGISVFGGLEEYEQLYYRLAGLPIAVFGVAGLVGSLLCAFAARVAHRLKGNVSATYFLPIASAVLLVFIWRYPSIAGICAYLVGYALTTPTRLLTEARIQHSIMSLSRATVTSTIASLLEAIGIGSLIIWGLISTKWHLPAIYLAGAIQLFVLAAWTFGMRKRMQG